MVSSRTIINVPCVTGCNKLASGYNEISYTVFFGFRAHEPKQLVPGIHVISFFIVNRLTSVVFNSLFTATTQPSPEGKNRNGRGEGFTQVNFQSSLQICYSFIFSFLPSISVHSYIFRLSFFNFSSHFPFLIRACPLSLLPSLALVCVH
jgi:hypothetical protein